MALFDNTQAQVLPDLRMNIIDPRIAKLQAIEPVKQRLRQEGAAMQPDFSALSELISDDMYYKDRVEDVAALNQIQEEYLQAGLRDPLKMFGPEAKNVLNHVRRFKNNPNRQEKVQAYKRGSEQLKMARDEKILNDVWVTDSGVQFVNGKPLTVQDAFEVYNTRLGSNPNLPEFTVNQTSVDTALKWMADFLSKAKSNTNTQFQGEGGDVLTTIQQSSNLGQIGSLLQTLIATGPQDEEMIKIGNRNINAIFGQAVRDLEGSGLDQNDLLREANKRAVNMIKAVATGESSVQVRASQKTAPRVSSLFMKSGMKTVDSSRALNKWFFPTDQVTIQGSNTKFTSPGIKETGLSTILQYGVPNNAANSTGERDPALAQNYLLQNSGFVSNWRITKPETPESVGLNATENIPNTPEGLQLRTDINENSIINPAGKVQYFFTVMDENGQFVSDGPVSQYGKQLAMANQEYLQSNRPDTQGFAKALEEAEIELNRQFGGANYRLQATMQVPVIYARTDWRLLGFINESTPAGSLIEDIGRPVDGSQVFKYFKGSGIETSKGLDESDDYFELTLISPVSHNARDWAYSDIAGGQPSFKPQTQRAFTGAGLGIMDVIDTPTPASGTSLDQLDELLQQQ